jgi:butyryl-CoA dehydrogenase
MNNPDQAGAAASEYLHLFGYTAFGYLWAKMAKVALAKAAEATGEEAAFYRAKVHTARFYVQRMLPRTGSLFATILSGSAPVMDFPDEAF